MTAAALRIATRRSALARAQSFQTGQALQRLTGRPFELVPMATTGDLEPDRAVEAFEVKGLFVDTVRRAVLDGDCDVAVHSAKDLPGAPVPGLLVGAYPPRADPRDLLVSRDGYALSTLPALATVGTSSQRRRLQLLKVKPALQVLPLRGNVDTRLRKVAHGELDAVVVAVAGLQRLYSDEAAGGVGPLGLPLKAVPLEPGECLPAPAQGALAVECRADDDATLGLLGLLDDADTRAAVTAEREFLATVGGGCLAPVGALATVDRVGGAAGGGLELLGLLADPARRTILRASDVGTLDDPAELGRRLAERMVRDGGDAILEAVQRLRASG